jgi:hypothetical protein
MNQSKGAQQMQHPPGGREPPGSQKEAKPALLPQLQDHIGRQLRAVYDDVLQQPVPDRFRELMEKLDRASGDES